MGHCGGRGRTYFRECSWERTLQGSHLSTDLKDEKEQPCEKERGQEGRRLQKGGQCGMKVTTVRGTR